MWAETTVSAKGPEVASMSEPGVDKAGGQERTVIDAAADLLQTVVDWLRQEAGAIVHDKIVIPLQRLGLTLSAASAAASLAVLGIAFIAVGLFMLLGEAIGYPFALLVIGGVLVIFSVVFMLIKMRLMQK